MGFFDRVGQLMTGRTVPNLDPVLDLSNQEVFEAHLSSLLASLLTMAWFVEARDPYTGGHLWRVSKYSELLAKACGESNASVAQISLGGFLHDLGKIGIPDAILNKADRLTDDEYSIIKTHPEMGFRMLGGHPLSDFVKDAVLLHHERPDGKGYPQGLSEKDIPLMARIVGLCDAFDAMTSSRPYRAGMPLEKALSIIEANLGSQFDKSLGLVFIRLGREGALNAVLGHSGNGIPLETCNACGFSLVIHKDHHEGESVFCRHCSGESKLSEQEGKLVPLFTGRKGAPMDSEPKLDQQLIAETVRQSIAALPVTEMTHSVMTNYQTN
ncbi:HD-GYP domain-containing protein [Marinomonas sp. 2405UD68-3]|uniref:HD-GYP domain-containing protein n=1 Tax=Marinomonas sp. 2405UD68-3 TaxID=3391835 RepID=UPI0039C9F7B2